MRAFVNKFFCADCWRWIFRRRFYSTWKDKIRRCERCAVGRYKRANRLWDIPMVRPECRSIIRHDGN